MTATASDLVHGLRAAAKLTGRSPSGVQKLIDVGKVAAERTGRSYSFHLTDLQAISRIGPQDAIIGEVETAPDRARAADESATVSDPPGSPVVRAPVVDQRDEGAIASTVFSDLASGKTLVEVVAQRKITPDVVRHHYDRWRELQAIDDAQAPSALDRLAQVEATVGEHAVSVEQSRADAQNLAARLDAAQASLEALADQLARTWRHVEGRLRGLDGRVNAAAGGALSRRLDAVEGQVRNLPAAPLLLDRRCGCGGPILVAAACSACGMGRGAG